MVTMQALGFVALFTGIAKSAILFFSHSDNKLSSAFTLLCISMVLQNILEFLVSITFESNPELAELLLHLEMSSIALLAFCLLTFALTVAENRFIKPITIAFGFWALACVALLFSGNLVLGYERAAYSVISIPGPYYAVINAYAFFAFNAVLIILCHAYFTANHEVRSSCRIVLIAIAPIYLLILIIQVTRLIGIHSTTAVSMPLATTFFVAMIVLHQSGRIVVFKIKWTVIWKLIITMRDVNLSRWTGLVEELMVTEAMRVTGNNQSEAAKLIKSNQSTVGRKFKKYEENASDEKVDGEKT